MIYSETYLIPMVDYSTSFEASKNGEYPEASIFP